MHYFARKALRIALEMELEGALNAKTAPKRRSKPRRNGAPNCARDGAGTGAKIALERALRIARYSDKAASDTAPETVLEITSSVQCLMALGIALEIPCNHTPEYAEMAPDMTPRWPFSARKHLKRYTESTQNNAAAALEKATNTPNEMAPESTA